MAAISISDLPSSHNVLTTMWAKLKARLDRTTTMWAKFRCELLLAVSTLRRRIHLRHESVRGVHIWVWTWWLRLRCNRRWSCICIVCDAFTASAPLFTVFSTFHHAEALGLSEEKRSSCWITSVHAGRAVVGIVGFETLQSRFHDRCHFVRVEMIHLATFICHFEHPRVGWADEVQECIAAVCLRLWIDWQVQEIISPQKTCLADFTQQHLLRVLVRYVAKHHGSHWGATVIAAVSLQVLRLRNTLRMVGLEAFLRLEQCVILLIPRSDQHVCQRQ
mmetsp:Transcript_41923/g.66584  ORF Transcript_41923/g.66584 Transcript_41923/m.66584 type:complete len:276 (+) Transcript_41923:216-1043(+)